MFCPIMKKCTSQNDNDIVALIERDSHFNKRIRVSISIHGCEMNTAYDADDEATQLTVIHEWYQNTASLLRLNSLFPGLDRETKIINRVRLKA